jgi:sialic acid synthase SpsE
MQLLHINSFDNQKMKTPLQQIKDNYYKMSESQFHYWMSQNIDKLVQEEKVTVVEAYEKGHTDREDNLYKLRVYLNTLYGEQGRDEWGDYI